MLATSETLNAAAPATLTTSPSSTNIALSWSVASGATNYRVERKSGGGSYGLLSTTTGTSTADNTASSGSAYLYRVCAADGSGNCTSGYSNIALGMAISFTDSSIVTYAENPNNATTSKAAHITELRTAVNAVRSLAGLASASWTNPTLTAQTSVISADDVRDLRTKLDEALSALGIQTPSYTDATLATGANGTVVKRIHITELRQRATSGSGTSGSGSSSGGLKYVLTDIQGSARAVMNNNGSSSAIVARHDYLPFGEEIGAGLGLRTTSQGFSATDTNRQKYGLTERDDATGLDHTWWRKYENTAGRWTSPDPYRGSMTIANPQSFNGYNYVQNDPVNHLDPTGLCLQWLQIISGYHYYINGHYAYSTVESVTYICITPDPPPLRNAGGRREFQHPRKQPQKLSDKEIQRRIDAGNAWEKWREWQACNERIKAKYRSQRENYLKEARTVEVYIAILGLAAILIGSRGASGLSIGPLAPLGQIVAERAKLNEVDANYKSERDRECGAEVSKPASHN